MARLSVTSAAVLLVVVQVASAYVVPEGKSQRLLIQRDLGSGKVFVRNIPDKIYLHPQFDDLNYVSFSLYYE